MNPILNIAIFAVRKAGNFIYKYYEENDNKKNEYSFTNINYKIENIIIEIIHNFYPNHTIFNKKNEEIIENNNETQWIINSLNKSINFIKHFPHFAISIAVLIKGRIEVSVIYDPIRNELFTASRGYGAQLNGHRIRVSTVYNLNYSILVTFFLFNQKKIKKKYIILINKLFFQCLDFRHTGSIALDLAYIASGRIDVFFSINIKHYEFASGKLLIQEAGGIIDFFDYHNNKNLNNVVAGNPKIVKSILSIIHNELNITYKK